MTLQVSQETVNVLTHALEDAKAGRITNVALIMVLGPGKVSYVSMPGMAFEKNFGADMLKRQLIEDAFRGAQNLIVQPLPHDVPFPEPTTELKF